MVKLNPKMAKVVAEVASGRSYRKVAREYKVSIGTISKKVHQVGLDIEKVRARRAGERGRYKAVDPKKYPEIVRWAIKGITHEELASEYGVSRPTITRIVNQFGWYSQKEPSK